MRGSVCAAVLLGFLASAQTVSAQQRVPFAGSSATGGDIGFFIPDPEFDIGPSLSGFAEFYPLARVSVRGLLGWVDPAFKRGTDDSLRQISLIGDVLYNWEGGVWHPFVFGGVGVHFLQVKENNRPLGDSETKGGLNAGVGIEYFSRRKLAIKIEAMYQFVAHGDFAPDPSGLVLKIGLKKYF